MVLEKQVIDIIVEKEREAFSKGYAPTVVVLSPFTYAKLKDELGIGLMDELSTYKGMEVAIKTSEEGSSVKVL